jgi:hypothetical protein
MSDMGCELDIQFQLMTPSPYSLQLADQTRRSFFVRTLLIRKNLDQFLAAFIFSTFAGFTHPLLGDALNILRLSHFLQRHPLGLCERFLLFTANLLVRSRKALWGLFKY